MYKTRLQELCHKKKWELPKYTSTRTATTFDKKNPWYTATVTVHDQVFETPENFKTVKEAQNTAARIAFDHLNVPPLVAAAANDSAPPSITVNYPRAPPPEKLPVFEPLKPSALPSSITGPPVSAQDQVFKTMGEFKKIKEAETTPSQIAFDHLNVPPQVVVANGSAPPTACTGAPPPVAAPSPEMQPVFDMLQPSLLTSSHPSPPPGQVLKKLEEFKTIKEAQNTPAQIAFDRTYKTRLQELCHKKKWELPKYSSTRSTTTYKNGPHNVPRYTATVSVQDQVFETLEDFKTIKEAQHSAARIAFDHFNVPPPVAAANGSARPTFNSELQTASTTAPLPVAASLPGTQPVFDLLQPSPIPSSITSPPPVSAQDQVFKTLGAFKTIKEAQTTPSQIAFDHLNVTPLLAVANGSAPPTFNSQLQTASTSAPLPLAASLPETQPICDLLQPSPIPSSITSPPPVSAQDQVFKTLGEFKTIKEAHTTPSQIAFDHLKVPPQVAVANGSAPPTACTGAPPPVVAPSPEMQPIFDMLQTSLLTSSHPSPPPGFYKNRLREFAKKKGLLCPSYDTVSSGMSHVPMFVSTVTIGTDTFRGDADKTKKKAETNAAKVAYFALTQGNISQNIQLTTANSSMAPTVNGCPVAGNISPNIQSTTTIRKCQDTSNEGSDPPAKRAKVSPQTLENQPWRLWKTVIIPRERDKEATA